ncbi:hypothetical protein, partial [Cupriavidus sp. DL-D2]|uniref:hypothetical protein n=1 Tax=Cupriavidus sp. DL-D2 TaxID=3144974 RepID=UPI00321287DF
AHHFEIESIANHRCINEITRLPDFEGLAMPANGGRRAVGRGGARYRAIGVSVAMVWSCWTFAAGVGQQLSLRQPEDLPGMWRRLPYADRIPPSPIR